MTRARPTKRRKARKFGTLTLRRDAWAIVQDAVDDFGPPLNPEAESRLADLRSKLHALTGEPMPPSKASKPDATPDIASQIHTPLTTDDVDAFDLLRARIEWQAMLVQHTLATWDEDHDSMEDRDRTTLERGLIELCASIGRDADALGELLHTAWKRDSRAPAAPTNEGEPS